MSEALGSCEGSNRMDPHLCKLLTNCEGSVGVKCDFMKFNLTGNQPELLGKC